MADRVITVVMVDITNFVHLQEPVSKRSVRLTLTPEQAALLKPRSEYESEAYCFLEPPESPDA